MAYCYFRVSVAGSKPETIVFKLETKLCPKTCENFMLFCKSTSQKSYKNTIFHRMIPGFMVQGGDYENGDGTGGEAFAGGILEDECFDMKHDGPFVLSMANRGINTAGSQFFITLGKASHLDGKHVAFGRVVEGMEILRKMEQVETDEKDKPINIQKIKILDSGIGYGDDDESESNGLSEEDRARKGSFKIHNKKLKRSKKYDSYSDEDSSSSEHKKSRRKKHHKHSKDSTKHSRRSRHESEDSSEDSSHHKKKRKQNDESHRDRKRRKKHKKRSRQDSYDSDDKKSSKRQHKDKKSWKRESDRQKESDYKHKENSFGKYGVIKESDLRTSSKVQRSFEIWLEEVKGIPQGSNVPKWELSEFFKEYAEDFNTATLPHEKFYDYDKWEVEEYNRRKNESQKKKGAISDEFEFQEEKKKQAEEKRKRELELVRMTMSREKIEDMKRQSRLKSELVNAYRVGDEQKRKKLQKKLEPDEK